MSVLRNRRVQAGLGLLLVLLLLAFWFLPRDDRRHPQDLLALLRAAEAANAAPGPGVAGAAAALATPQEAAIFLRAGVRLQDYAGRLLTPEDVLHLRGANALDQAVLLHALIAAQGHEARIMVSDWPAGEVPRGGTGTGRAGLDALHAYFDLDPSELRQRQAVSDLAVLEALQAQVDAAVAALQPLVPVNAARSGQRPGQRAWVEYRDQDGWRVADPVFPPGAADPAAGTPLDPGPVRELTLRLDMVASSGERHLLAEFAGSAARQIELRFLPATGVRAFLSGPLDPQSVTAWTPVLMQGESASLGRAFSAAGRLVPAPRDDAAPGPAPRLTRASVLGVDLSAYPEVAVEIGLDAPHDARFAAAHLRLDEDGVAKPVRIEAVPDRPAHLMIVTDVSPSMVEDGVLFSAGKVGTGIMAGITDRDRFAGAVAVAGQPVVTRRLTWAYSPPVGTMPRNANAIAEYGAGLTVREGDNLAAGVGEALRLSPGGDMVILTDGRFDREADFEAFSAAVGKAAGRVHVVVPEAAAPRLQPLVSSVWILPEDEDKALALGQAIALSGTSLRAVYTSTEAEPGRSRGLVIGFPDSAVSTDAEFTQPEPALDARARLELSATLGGMPLGQPRTLFRLGQPETAWSLIGQHSLFVSGGRFDSAALTRRFIADRRYGMGLALGAASGAPEVPVGAAHDLMGIAAQLVSGAEAAAGGEIILQRPMALILSGVASPAPDGDVLNVSSMLDVLDDGGLSRAGGTRAALGLAAAEADAIGGESVNTMLAGEPLSVIDPLTPFPDWLPPPARRLVADGARTLVTAPGKAGGWLLEPDGSVSARLFGDQGAKGASSRRTARDFRQIRTMINALGIVASGTGSPYGVNGASLGGIIALLDADMRLLCFSSVMMGYVADSIEAGVAEPGDWQGDAGQLCDINPDNVLRDYLASVAAGWAGGKFGDDVTAWVKSSGGLTHWTEVAVNTTAGGFVEVTSLTNPIKTAIRDGVPPPDPAGIP